MKLIINLLLVGIIAALVWALFSGISEPIKFRTEKDKRKDIVVERLVEIREAQKMFMDIEGRYAKNFGELKDTLRQKDLFYVAIIGDEDDPNFDIANLQFDTTYVPAIDSIRSKGINLDSLSYVPYSNGKEFTITADTITYQKTLTHVMEVSTPWKSFMGKYADPFYAKYDDMYNPNARVKFGSMGSPSLSGNWE